MLMNLVQAFGQAMRDGDFEEVSERRAALVKRLIDPDQAAFRKAWKELFASDLERISSDQLLMQKAANALWLRARGHLTGTAAGAGGPSPWLQVLEGDPTSEPASNSENRKPKKAAKPASAKAAKKKVVKSTKLAAEGGAREAEKQPVARKKAVKEAR